MFDLKDRFCSYCAYPFNLNQVTYPKVCVDCGNTIYKNPIPVVVTLVGSLIGKELKMSLLVIKRNNEPKKDHWALPGGFLECNETWDQGSAREVFEETGIVINPSDLNICDIFTASNSNLIIFNFCWVDNLDLTKFVPNDEVSEVRLITEPEELAFPSHTEIIKRYLKVYNG